MNTKIKACALALFASVSLSIGSAMAGGWPASVAAPAVSPWRIVGNQSAGTLVITQFPSPELCKPIRGVIYGVDNIEGFYCPGSGRISFARYVGHSTSPKQYWSGNLSQVVFGQPLRMGGSFAAFPHNNVSGTVGGSLGEYNFQGQR